MKKKVVFGNLIFYALVFVILLSTVLILFHNDDTTEELTYAEVKDLFYDEQVKAFVVDDGVLILELHEAYRGYTTWAYELAHFDVFYYDLGELIEQQHEEGILEDYDYPPSRESPWWLSFLPYIIVVVILLVLWYFMMTRAMGGGDNSKVMKFAKARTHAGSEEAVKVTFNDVAGAEEEKAELEEIVEFLKDPSRFTALGVRIPKGVLLVGPPGTGKTLLAKAVAGEASVQFLSISGSDFVELYVGVGASRVRDLFDQAKKNSPCIIFIDEIDAVGRRRGAGLGGGHDEREQTLNQLLVEMDGFGNNEGVIVMAATNRVDILDPALLRPGRFDRQIYVGSPDTKGREDILKIHSRGKPLAEDVDLSVIAKSTAGFTGADLENLMNESALLAARNGQRFIHMKNLEEAIIKVIAGPEKKSRVVSQRERRLTAVHEAGHAIVMHVLPSHDEVHQISIVPRGQAGGMTISLPSEDRSYASRNEMYEQIVSLLGGRVAESLLLDDISTGASNDIQRATSIAREMVSKYGMSEKLGAVSYDSDSEVFIGRDYGHTKSYSERVAGDIDQEVSDLISSAMTRCRDILTANLDKLEAVADYLLEHETMSGAEFLRVLGEAPRLEDGRTAAQAAEPPEAEGSLPDCDAAEFEAFDTPPEGPDRL